MRSICAVLAVAAALVGIAYGQTIDPASFQAGLNAAVDNSDLFSGVTTERGCQANAKSFVKTCTLDLQPFITDISQVFDTSTQKINGGGVNAALDKLTTASDACCGFACNIAKSGCGCNKPSWDALVAAFGGSTGDVSNVITKFEGLCNKAPRNFRATIFGSETCTAEYGQNEVPNFQC